MGLCLGTAGKHSFEANAWKDASGASSTNDIIEAVRLGVFTSSGSPFDRGAAERRQSIRGDPRWQS